MKDLIPLEGKEKIQDDAAIIGEVSEFWKWSYSCLNSPTVRGDFAEYLVYLALKGRNISDRHYQTRMDWDMVDLTYGRGILPPLSFTPFCESTSHGWGVEVKSSSTLNKSGVRFDISPKKGFHVKSNKVVEYRRNWADIHIFALLTNEENRVTSLNLKFWEFYVIPTAKIDCFRRLKKKQYKSISLAALLQAGAVKCHFVSLQNTVDGVIKRDYCTLKDWKIEHDILKRDHVKK